MFKERLRRRWNKAHGGRLMWGFVRCRQFTDNGRTGFWYLLKMGQCDWRLGRVESGWGRGQRWRMVFHSQSVWSVRNEWVCSPSLTISRTHKHCWFTFAHSGSPGWFISTYALKCRNFGRVTTSTNRTCPWAALFLPVYRPFSLSASSSFRPLPFRCSASLHHQAEPVSSSDTFHFWKQSYILFCTGDSCLLVCDLDETNKKCAEPSTYRLHR